MRTKGGAFVGKVTVYQYQILDPKMVECAYPVGGVTGRGWLHMPAG